MPPSVSVRLPAPAGTHNACPFFAYGLKRKEREEERDGSRREGAAFLLSLPSFARPSVRVHFGGYFWLPTAREQQNQLYGSARSLRVPQSNSGDRAAVSGCTARIHPPSNQLSLHPSILREREREKRWVSCLRLRGKRENQLRRNRPSPSPSPPRPRTPAPSSFVMHSLSVKRRRREEGREGQEALRKKEGRKAAHSFGRREREREREREGGKKEPLLWRLFRLSLSHRMGPWLVHSPLEIRSWSHYRTSGERQTDMEREGGRGSEGGWVVRPRVGWARGRYSRCTHCPNSPR